MMPSQFTPNWLLAAATTVVPPALAGPLATNIMGPEVVTSWERAGIAAISLGFGVIMFIRTERRDKTAAKELKLQRDEESAERRAREDRYEAAAAVDRAERNHMIEELIAIRQCDIQHHPRRRRVSPITETLDNPTNET
jgi:hypothetical protein